MIFLLDAYHLSDLSENQYRGMCLIINIKEFKDLKPRLGTDIDADRIKALFKAMRFEVIELGRGECSESDRQTTNEDIESFLDLYQDGHENVDMLVMFVLSHGKKDCFLSYDEQEIPISMLKDVFNKSKSLSGKPKIFVIQACQGSERPKSKLKTVVILSFIDRIQYMQLSFVIFQH